MESSKLKYEIDLIKVEEELLDDVKNMPREKLEAIALTALTYDSGILYALINTKDFEQLIQTLKESGQ